jgi:hypothetical protein
MSDTELGALTAALAKSQSAFGAVKRDKKVIVQTKSGGSYSFDYAPLETILAAVRQPLADNGLVILQTLDDGALVTTLLHESGGQVSGRMALPAANDIKELGSTITYLRRYAIQALLGIAAEDDDDGSRATGDELQTRTTGAETTELLGRVDVHGKAQPGSAGGYKGEYRETPDGFAIGFALARNGDKNLPQVLIVGDVAAALRTADPGASFMGSSVHVKGRLYAVKTPGRTGYNRLIVGEADGHFIETSEWRIPAEDVPSADHVPVEAESVPIFDAAEDAAITAALP